MLFRYVLGLVLMYIDNIFYSYVSNRLSTKFYLFNSERQLIKRALTNNDFLKKIDKNQIYEIVNCMKVESYKQGQFIVKQLDGGNHFYVSAGNAYIIMYI